MFGFIGGSGLYKMEGLSAVSEKNVVTPFGMSSAPVTLGKIGGVDVAFLPRHGRNHSLIPGEINSRANIWALKSAGVTQIVGISAVGSLAQDIPPGDLALVGQYFDWTRGKRAYSFFGEGIVAHVSMAEPTCAVLTKSLGALLQKVQTKLHTNKTYGCVEGPRFGTKAESHFLRQVGCHLVGMTNIPEAFLAREAQICYSAIGVVTDYDCWMEDAASHVTVEKMLELYGQSLKKVESILLEIPNLAVQAGGCGCRKALTAGLMTPMAHMNSSQRLMVEVLLQ